MSTTSVYKLLALDLDGTLLPRSQTLSSRTIRALERVSSHGAVVALVTGRTLASTASVSAQLPFANFSIVAHGAAAFPPKLNAKIESLFATPLSPPSVDAIVAVADELDLAVEWHETHGKVKLRATSEKQRMRVDAALLYHGSSAEIVVDFESAEPPVKILLLTDQPQPVKEYLASRVPGITAYSERLFVDCVSDQVNKAIGLRKLCEALHVHMNDVVAFGDGWNDVDMLKEVGLSFAMANAVDGVKDASHRVARFSNEEDGVAHEVEELLSQGFFGVIPRVEATAADKENVTRTRDSGIAVASPTSHR
ncbi:HAD-like domain-containing protein [Chytriomyces sp. MP71]|nr:HAD-like domain-containing protein [Chytriomyces sp. MP71]